MPEKKPDWSKKRCGRIKKRCVPEVIEAIGRGYLSSSSADKVYRYLRPEEQRARVKRLVESKESLRERCRIVVEILRRHLEGGVRDLHDLGRDLKVALGARRERLDSFVDEIDSAGLPF
jgi:hypothetical protein